MFLPKPLRGKAPPRCPVRSVAAACTCIRLFIVSIGWVTSRAARPLAAPATNWSKKEEGDDKNNVVFSTTTSSPSLLLLSKSSRISKKESLSTPMFFIYRYSIASITSNVSNALLLLLQKSLLLPRVKKNTSIPRRPLLTTTTKFSFVVVCLFCVCVSSLISKYSRCIKRPILHTQERKRERRESKV